MIDVSDPDYSVSEQCRLLNLARSSYYHAGVGESEEDLVLKRHLDQLYTAFPFFGSRKMVVELVKLGFRVCRKRVRRLMREMGIWAIYPKPRLSENRENHRKYQYLLNNFKVEEPWQAFLGIYSSDQSQLKCNGIGEYFYLFLENDKGGIQPPDVIANGGNS